ncbi:MAG: type II toxin-antitoxin system RelE/ParE family toxin [Candidatus Planktophila sp.]|nr:type II toxin-antitoxin system RelE/ParE family toxin [Candidatus Planktophila sp.]
MSHFKIEFKAVARKSLEKLEKQDQLRIYAAIELLGDNPRPPLAVKIKGSDYFRVRVGDYRILYSIDSGRLIILIIDLGHRREIYRTVN